jgi:hypothetical protein
MTSAFQAARAASADAGTVVPLSAEVADRVAVEAADHLMADLARLVGAANIARTSTAAPPPGTAAQPPEPRTPILDLERLEASATLMAAATAFVVSLAHKVAPTLAAYLAESDSLSRALTWQILGSARTYTGTTVLRREIAEGRKLEEARISDVEGIVNYAAGKVNELFVLHHGELHSRLFAEALARYSVAPPSTWDYPSLASQVEIDTGKGFRLAQDLLVFSPGRGAAAGLIRLWSWGQITMGDPEHLVQQTDSDFYRLGRPKARMRINGTVYDVASQIVGGPPIPGTPIAATTGVLGASVQPPGGLITQGLMKRGVAYVPLPWSAQDLRTLVRTVLLRAGKLGQ